MATTVGLTIAPEKPAQAARPAAAAPDLASLTVPQLRELCAERGVEAPKRATKAQLVLLLGA